MYAITLAGGYATRLRQTSLSFTEHLVPLANKSVLDGFSQIAGSERGEPPARERLDSESEWALWLQS
ncbi:MAG: hypothetical protein ACP5IE_00530, partial [Infirmifilum sp.]